MAILGKRLVCLGIVLLLARLGFGNEPVTIAKDDSSSAPRQPQLAIDESGTIHVVFGQKNVVYYSQSRDGGKSFCEAVPLPETSVMVLGMRRGPRIAATSNNICISFVGGKQGKGKDGDVLAFNSIDGGQNWNGPVAVNEVTGSGREGLHAMAAGPSGAMCCVWLDLRDQKNRNLRRSVKGRWKGWGQNVCVYRSPDGSVCECCHPSVAYDASGGVHVMWRNSLAGARDMYVASSSDGGRTFSPAKKLGTGTWPLKACPMDGGYLAASPKGEIFAAWRRDSDVFSTSPQRQEEQRLGAGRQPWIKLTGNGPYRRLDGEQNRPAHVAASE